MSRVPPFINAFLLVLLFFCTSCTGNDESRRWLLAEEYVKQGNFRRAIDEYTRIVNSSSNPARAIRAQMQIANIYSANIKDYSKAIASFRKAADTTTETSLKIQARVEVAKIFSEKLDSPGSAAKELELVFDELAKDEKEGPEILLLCAKNLMDSGAFEEAAQKYSKFRSLYPGHKEGPRTLFEEAQAQLAARNIEASKALYRETISKFSDNADYSGLVGEAYYGLGNALEASGELNAALEAFRNSLTLYPNKKVIELKIERVLKRQKEKQI